MCQSALACWRREKSIFPCAPLMYLAISQGDKGGFAQNFFIDGEPHWNGVQLDEFSFPIILAYRLNEFGALQLFDPRRWYWPPPAPSSSTAR